jgi:hypothetical protein
MKNRTAVVSLLFVVILWWPILYILENLGSQPAGLHFWLRVLVGGWPVADWGHPETSAQFTTAVTLALLLRLAPIWLLVDMLIIVMRGARDQTMNIAQSLVLRDRSIKNSILTQFREDEQDHIRRVIDHAFNDGNRVWETQHLVTALGKDGAEKVKKTLNSEVT